MNIRLSFQGALFGSLFALPLLALIWFVFPELRAYFYWLSAGSIIIAAAILVGWGILMERHNGTKSNNTIHHRNI